MGDVANSGKDAQPVKTVEAQPAPESSTAQSAPASYVGIKKRNPFLVFLFALITFGIYMLYWIYSTTTELKTATQSAPNPMLVLLFLVPIVNIFVALYFYWNYSKAINELTGFNNVVLFLLWIAIAPVAMIISQVQLNTKAV